MRGDRRSARFRGSPLPRGAALDPPRPPCPRRQGSERRRHRYQFWASPDRDHRPLPLPNGGLSGASPGAPAGPRSPAPLCRELSRPAERQPGSEPGAAWPQVTAWEAGEGVGRVGPGRRCGAGIAARRPPPARDSTAQPDLRAAFLRWVGDGLKCLRPGARPEPRGRGDHDAAAGDPQPAMGGGFRRGRAAAVSELPGQRASEPGASPSLEPRRLLLCPPSSLSGPGRAALVVGLPVESFFGPQRGEACPNWGAL